MTITISFSGNSRRCFPRMSGIKSRRSRRTFPRSGTPRACGFFEHAELDELSRTFALKIIEIRPRRVLIPEQSGLQCRHRSTHGGWTGTGYGGPPYKPVQGSGCSTHRAVSYDVGWTRKVLANKPRPNSRATSRHLATDREHFHISPVEGPLWLIEALQTPKVDHGLLQVLLLLRVFHA